MNDKHFLTTLVILIFSVSTLVAMGKKVDAPVPRTGQTVSEATIQQTIKTIPVEGMTCGGCASSVKTALSTVDGVSESVIDVEKGSATVTYDASKTSLTDIKSAIESSGFRTSN